MRPLATIIFALGATSAAQAQVADGRMEGADSLAARIAAAAALPALAEEIRGAGVSQPDLAAVLAVLAERKLPATDARSVLEEEWKAAREHGPVPGLGRFVRGRLDEGLRGQALADAIRREHVRRGTGGDQSGRASRREGGTTAPSPADKRRGAPAGRPKSEHR
ncbi:MAG: hypothetical protein ACM357_08805 [Gemmatimonadota bacterium]